MERIDFSKQKIPFTQVANDVIYDKRLSVGAKTLYAYMYSKPDGWQFSSERIGKELVLSKPTVLGYLKELRENGYLIAQKMPDGRMQYKILFPPIEPESNNFTMVEKPKSKKATVKNLHREETLPLSNTDIKVIKSISNKEYSCALFDEFWNSYPRKLDKKKALTIWNRLKVTEELHKTIMQGLEQWKQSEQWSDERYIPHPTTWLNNERWENPPPAPRKLLNINFDEDGNN